MTLCLPFLAAAVSTGGDSIAELTIAFLTLCALEVVLGIDNIIFISILASKLPHGQQAKARLIGLSLAMITRVLLLLSISWMAQLTAPIFSVMGQDFSGRDLILILGGLFLVWKSTSEIHEKLEGTEEAELASVKGGKAIFSTILIQIVLLDIVFSLDSVITAVGMVNNLPIMVAAVIIAVIFMMFCSGAISDFVNRHPTIKMLAISFLLLVGVALIADGFGQHIPKGYIYFAMGFSVFVEFLNIRIRKKSEPPVKLRN